MEIALVLVIVLLIAVIITLTVYNISISKKIEAFTSLNQKVMNLNVLQDFMDTISENSTMEEKLKKINEILIDKYDIAYSTIVIYNGAEYVIKATNVEEKYWNTMRNLQSESCFKHSIQVAESKYITIDKDGERMPYQKETVRAKSAIFFPLYVENVYIGYWILEGTKPHEYDNIDMTLLEIVKNNIVTVLKSVRNQTVVEEIDRIDKFTGLHSGEYLYGKGRNKIEEYITSTICMIKITNIDDINRRYGRYTGNDVIKRLSEVVKNKISDESIFVRYMGPKFAIAFPGVDIDTVTEKIKMLKNIIESQMIPEVKIDGKDTTENRYAQMKVNIALATYYKGTAIEGVTKSLETYLDTANPRESNINYI